MDSRVDIELDDIIEMDSRNNVGSCSFNRAEVIDRIAEFAEEEEFFKVANGYSLNSRFIRMRPVMIAYATKYTTGLNTWRVAVTATTMDFADLFLSTNQVIPVVRRGHGVKLHLQIFVFACAILACRDRGIFNDEFEFLHLWNRHQVAAVGDIIRMVRLIKGVLNDRKKGSPVKINYDMLSAWDGATDFCILVTNNFEKDLDSTIVWEILVAIKRDIKFTEFTLHTLMAAAVLVTVYRTQPELLPWFEEQLESDYLCVVKDVVTSCFTQMKDHFLVDEVIMFPKKPRLLRDIPVNNNGREGEPDVCSVEETSVEEACERFTEFDEDWLGQESES